MITHKEDHPPIIELVCGTCGETVSGSDKESIGETMARHYAKTGHKAGAR